MREKALMEKETQQIRQELEDAKSQIQNVIYDFEKQLKVASPEQYNTLIRKSESAIASVVEAFHPGHGIIVTETDISSYTPQVGEQVLVRKLGNQLATVVEAPVDDSTILVQYGKIRVRVKKGDVRAISSNKRSEAINLVSSRKQVCTAYCSSLVVYFPKLYHPRPQLRRAYIKPELYRRLTTCLHELVHLSCMVILNAKNVENKTPYQQVKLEILCILLKVCLVHETGWTGLCDYFYKKKENMYDHKINNLY